LQVLADRSAHVQCPRYVAESGCKWAALAKRFDHWHTIYSRMAALFVMDVSHRSRISQIRLHQLLVVLSLTKLAYTPSNISWRVMKKYISAPRVGIGPAGTPAGVCGLTDREAVSKVSICIGNRGSLY
jgi:hypothetical protein